MEDTHVVRIPRSNLLGMNLEFESCYTPVLQITPTQVENVIDAKRE